MRKEITGTGRIWAETPEYSKHTSSKFLVLKMATARLGVQPVVKTTPSHERRKRKNTMHVSGSQTF